LKEEFSLHDEWLPFEIHPETPAGGVLLAESLPHIDWDELYERLRVMGAPYGKVFSDVRFLPNSHEVLQAGEYALEQGRFDQFNEAVFRAYFTGLEDIGSREVIVGLAAQCGLDAADLSRALDENRYAPRLREVTGMARAGGINSAPTFIIDNRYAVVGMQPEGQFRQLLGKITGARTHSAL
jgi:predicted DsbA family dithiol-disulfide isomerase